MTDHERGYSDFRCTTKDKSTKKMKELVYAVDLNRYPEIILKEKINLKSSMCHFIFCIKKP